ncbi:hypothetical protein LINPERPRIM_LOCUS6381 [Linum perenne]
MPLSLFNRILDGVVQYYPYFKLGADVSGRSSFSPQQKLTSAFRMLAYGCSADSVDEYCRMGETTSLECLRKFCNANINIYGSRYLCEPTVDDLCRLLDHSTRHGFLGMIGSLDSMHWEWKKFPTVWARQYTGHQKKPTIVLKAVGSYDTWIWNACFEMTGSNMDINTLGMSSLFDRAVYGSLPQVTFEVHGKICNQCYYLVDRIYPPWATLVKTISNPTSKKKQLFAQYQEAY